MAHARVTMHGWPIPGAPGVGEPICVARHSGVSICNQPYYASLVAGDGKIYAASVQGVVAAFKRGDKL